MEVSDVPSSHGEEEAMQLSAEMKNMKYTGQKDNLDNLGLGKVDSRNEIVLGDPEQKIQESKKLKSTLSHEQSSEPEDIQVEEMIEKIRKKQIEIEGSENKQLLLEILKLNQETQEERSLRLTFNKVVALYLSFYGLWREAERFLRWNEQFEMKSGRMKQVIDIYDFVVQFIQDKIVLSEILKLCCRTEQGNKERNSDQGVLQQSDGDYLGESSGQTNQNDRQIQGNLHFPNPLSSKDKKVKQELEMFQPENMFTIPKDKYFSVLNSKSMKMGSLSKDDMVFEDKENPKDKEEIEVKEVLLVNMIQTFNLRLNVISSELYEWLIRNEKLNIIELFLENQLLSTSTKRQNYEKTKKQEQRMLKYLHEYLITKTRLYNSEIELLLNLNENGLQLLSMVYTRFLIKYLKIPAYCISNRYLIKEAVGQMNVPLISQMINYSKEITEQTFLSSKIQRLVLCFLAKSDTFVCGVYFLQKMSQKKQKEIQQSEYFDQVLRLLSKPQNDEQFTLELTEHCLHPLVLCLICSKILLKLSTGKNPFSSEMLKLANFYLSRAVSYRDAIYDAREMSLLLFKPIFPSDKPLIKALRNSKYSSFFTDFFVHPCISYLLEQKFMSTYGWDKMIFGPLTPFSHFLGHSKIKNPFSKAPTGSSSSASSYNKSMKSGSNSGFFNSESRKQNWCIFNDIEVSNFEKISKNNHLFSFAIFNKSVMMRILAELIAFCLITSALMYYFFLYINGFNTFITTDEETKLLLFESKIPSAFQAGIEEYSKTHSSTTTSQDTIDQSISTDQQIICDLLLSQLSSGYPAFINYFMANCIILVNTGQLLRDLLSKVIIACWIFVTLGVNVIQKQAYSYLICKRITLSVQDYNDLLLSIACISFLIIKEALIPLGISNAYTLSYFTFWTTVLKYETCCIVFLIWVRSFLFLIRSQKIGILVRIITLFVKDLLQFTIVLGTVVVAFGTLNYILFQNELQIYQTFQASIYSLIAAVFGAFDFTDQNGIQSIILIVFLFAANIVLMNLLVAILNSRYEQTMLQSEMEYALIVYNDYVTLRFHPLYSCLITLPPPLNLFNIILGIPAVLLKSRKWNQFALKIEYTTCILIPMSLFFIVAAVFNTPLSYIFMSYKIVIYSIQDNLMNARKRNFFYKMSINSVRLLTWIVFGIPYLLIILIVNDVPLFFKQAFLFVDNKYTFTKNLVLDIRVLRYASISSNYLHSAHDQVINYIEFIRALENKKQAKLNLNEAKSKFHRFMQGQQAKQFQQLRQTPSSGLEKLEPEKIVEKNFNGALKKFGDGKSFKVDNNAVQLQSILRAIKYSAIFFKKSKRTSFHISRLLYIVRKKDLFSNLLEENSSNFFLQKSYSFQNVGMKPEQMQ